MEGLSKTVTTSPVDGSCQESSELPHVGSRMVTLSSFSPTTKHRAHALQLAISVGGDQTKTSGTIDKTASRKIRKVVLAQPTRRVVATLAPVAFFPAVSPDSPVYLPTRSRHDVNIVRPFVRAVARTPIVRCLQTPALQNASTEAVASSTEIHGAKLRMPSMKNETSQHMLHSTTLANAAPKDTATWATDEKVNACIPRASGSPPCAHACSWADLDGGTDDDDDDVKEDVSTDAPATTWPLPATRPLPATALVISATTRPAFNAAKSKFSIPHVEAAHILSSIGFCDWEPSSPRPQLVSTRRYI